MWQVGMGPVRPLGQDKVRVAARGLHGCPLEMDAVIVPSISLTFALLSLPHANKVAE